MRLTILCLAFFLNIPLGWQISLEQKRALELREPTSKFISLRGDIQTTWLGIYADPNYSSGVLIANIEQGSPAQKAGLHLGDVIVKWSGATVKDVRMLVELIKSSKIGSTVEIEVSQSG